MTGGWRALLACAGLARKISRNPSACVHSTPRHPPLPAPFLQYRANLEGLRDFLQEANMKLEVPLVVASRCGAAACCLVLRCVSSKWQSLRTPMPLAGNPWRKCFVRLTAGLLVATPLTAGWTAMPTTRSPWTPCARELPATAGASTLACRVTTSRDQSRAYRAMPRLPLDTCRLVELYVLLAWVLPQQDVEWLVVPRMLGRVRWIANGQFHAMLGGASRHAAAIRPHRRSHRCHPPPPHKGALCGFRGQRARRARRAAGRPHRAAARAARPGAGGGGHVPRHLRRGCVPPHAWGRAVLAAPRSSL